VGWARPSRGQVGSQGARRRPQGACRAGCAAAHSGVGAGRRPGGGRAGAGGPDSGGRPRSAGPCKGACGPQSVPQGPGGPGRRPPGPGPGPGAGPAGRRAAAPRGPVSRRATRGRLPATACCVARAEPGSRRARRRGSAWPGGWVRDLLREGVEPTPGQRTGRWGSAATSPGPRRRQKLFNRTLTCHPLLLPTAGRRGLPAPRRLSSRVRGAGAGLAGWARLRAWVGGGRCAVRAPRRARLLRRVWAGRADGCVHSVAMYSCLLMPTMPAPQRHSVHRPAPSPPALPSGPGLWRPGRALGCAGALLCLQLPFITICMCVVHVVCYRARACAGAFLCLQLPFMLTCTCVVFQKPAMQPPGSRQTCDARATVGAWAARVGQAVLLLKGRAGSRAKSRGAPFARGRTGAQAAASRRARRASRARLALGAMTWASKARALPRPRALAQKRCKLHQMRWPAVPRQRLSLWASSATALQRPRPAEPTAVRWVSGAPQQRRAWTAEQC